MYCDQCSANNSEDALFCWNCGTALGRNTDAGPGQEEIGLKKNKWDAKKKLLGILSALLFVLVIAVAIVGKVYIDAENVKKDYTQVLQLGDKYMEEMDYESAILAYEKAIEIDPDNKEAYEKMADLLRLTGNETAAEEILSDQSYENVAAVLAKNNIKTDAGKIDKSPKQEAGQDKPGNRTLDGQGSLGPDEGKKNQVANNGSPVVGYNQASFYVFEENLYEDNLVSGTQELLLKNVTGDLWVYEEELIFTSANKICAMDLNKRQTETLHEGEPGTQLEICDFNLEEGTLCFIQPGPEYDKADILYNFDVEETKPVKVEESQLLREGVYYDDGIVYQAKSEEGFEELLDQVYKVDENGSSELLYQARLDQVAIWGVQNNWVYLTDTNRDEPNQGYISRIQINTKEIQELHGSEKTEIWPVILESDYILYGDYIRTFKSENELSEPVNISLAADEYAVNAGIAYGIKRNGMKLDIYEYKITSGSSRTASSYQSEEGALEIVPGTAQVTGKALYFQAQLLGEAEESQTAVYFKTDLEKKETQVIHQ